MEIVADMHCHTVASSHAYSTVVELAHMAAGKGLKMIAVTDHGPAIPDGAHPWHFGNLHSLPPYIEGVRVLCGAEANITDFQGGLDIDTGMRAGLDWVIASFHGPVCAPGTVEQHTRAYLALADDPFVDVIGHSGTEEYRYDYEAVLPVFKQQGKLVEINSHSFAVRAGAPKNCRDIALLCKKYEVPVIVDSDAHSCFDVGAVDAALQMLHEIEFPEKLVVNADTRRLAKWVNGRRDRTIVEGF